MQRGDAWMRATHYRELHSRLPPLLHAAPLQERRKARTAAPGAPDAASRTRSRLPPLLHAALRPV